MFCTDCTNCTPAYLGPSNQGLTDDECRRLTDGWMLVFYVKCHATERTTKEDLEGITTVTKRQTYEFAGRQEKWKLRGVSL